MKSMTWYQSLEKPRVRIAEGFFLMEGFRPISQVLTAAPQAIVEILALDSVAVPPGFTGTVHRITERQLNRLAQTQSPQGIIAVCALPEGTDSSELPANIAGPVLVCEHIQDPGNTGTLIRTAAAFDFSGVILSRQCADPFSPKVVQAAAGALLSLWIRRSSCYFDMVRRLKSRGFRLIAADIRGTSTVLDFSAAPQMLALGNEGAGLSKELSGTADLSFRIPINAKHAESLNVGIAGAICMYLLRG
jgi:TrmH family RNA methyltransferase